MPTELALSPDEVRIWVTDLGNAGARTDEYWRSLNREERSRAAAYRLEPLRQRFVAARGFLRHALAQYAGVPPADLAFEYGAAGKPSLAAGDVTFNLSHSENLAALAIARARAVGIDVELIRPGRDFQGLAQRFFGLDEARRVAGAPARQRAEAFYFHWTCKEAWLKAHGDGLLVPLDSFQILPDSSTGSLTVEAPRGRAALHVRALTLAPGAAAALACDGAPPRLTIARWT
jgi:4'-phosphopantetheinyl transferase